jgi:fructokinase
MVDYYLGLDIGGTKVECVLIAIDDGQPLTEFNKNQFLIPGRENNNLNARILERMRIPTGRDLGYQSVLERVSSLCVQVCEKQNFKLEQLAGLGIGLPGTVDPHQGKMLNGNSGIFIGKNVIKDMQVQLDFPLQIKVHNDASCFALAETLCGVGQDYFRETTIPVNKQTTVGIILGTGTGGGIIVNGRILQGRNGGGAEIGHIELHENGLDCYCGQKGCSEQYLAGPSFEKTYQGKERATEIFDAAEKGDNPEAIDLTNQYREHLKKLLRTLTNIIDPDYFVLGGGLSNCESIYNGMESFLENNTFVPESRPKVLRNKLGDSAGVIGAAMLLLK